LEILAVKINLFDALLTKWRKPVLSIEIQMLNILPSEKVLHLGCGAFPSATIFIAERFIESSNNRTWRRTVLPGS
jgi:hypothetical protein